MSNKFYTEKYILDGMLVVRDICSIISSIRQEMGLPNKLRLQEVQIDIDRYDGLKIKMNQFVLFKDMRDLISDESNIDFVEQFLVDDKHPEDYVTKKVDGLTVKLHTNYTPGAWNDYIEKNEYSKKMMAEKMAGTYDEFTYKKYKV